MAINLIYDGIIFEKQKFGGISRVFNELIARVPNAIESDAEIITSNEWRSKLKPQHLNISHTRLPNIAAYLSLIFLFRYKFEKFDLFIKSLYASIKGDIWHSTEYSVPYFFKGPTFCSIHDMIPELFPELLPKTYVSYVIPKKKKAIYKSDHLIAVSETTKKDILKVYPDVPSTKISVVHNAYNKDIFYDRNVNREPFILYIGGRAEYKGFTLLAKTLNKMSINIKLVLVGGPLNKKEIALCNFEVDVRQDISDEKLAKLYSKASAFIYPSFYEGFGIPLLEAMACNCPIVASAIPSSKEVASEVPYYFTSGEQNSLLEALKSALNKEGWDKRQKLSKVIIAKFDWDKSAKKLAKLYAKFIDE